MKNDYASRRLERYIGYNVCAIMQLDSTVLNQFLLKGQQNNNKIKCYNLWFVVFKFVAFFVCENFFFIVHCMKAATELYRIGNISFLSCRWQYFYWCARIRAPNNDQFHQTYFDFFFSFDFTLSTTFFFLTNTEGIFLANSNKPTQEKVTRCKDKSRKKMKKNAMIELYSMQRTK